MSETVIGVLQKAIESADTERERLIEELGKVEANSAKLRKIIYAPYDGKGPIPKEFSDPHKFLKIWDATDKALGNTILMVMPPSIFETTRSSEPEKGSNPPVQPINIITAEPKEAASMQTSRGFWSGIMDYSREKLRLTGRKTETPTITSNVVTYDPKEIVYQLIPSLNEIKSLYFTFLERHLSYDSPSTYLIRLGHARLQEEMSKYFNVVHPFCIASIKFQQRQIRQDRMGQMDNFTRIAVASEEAKAMSMPYIPPEVRAFVAAMQEGKEFNPKGFKVPGAKKLAEKHKRKSE